MIKLNWGKPASKISKPSHDRQRVRVSLHEARMVTWTAAGVLVAMIVGIAGALEQAKAMNVTEREQTDAINVQNSQTFISLGTTIATYWDTNLDPDTRYHYQRFVRMMRLLSKDQTVGKSEEARQYNDEVRACMILSNPDDAANYEKLSSCASLFNLVRTDVEFLDKTKGLSPNSQLYQSEVEFVAVKYRTAVVKRLNTFETICDIRARINNTDPLYNRCRDEIDKGYEDAIVQGTDELMPFIKRWRQSDSDAWQIIDEVRTTIWRK